MSKIIKATLGTGENKIEFELSEEQASKVKRLQKHFRLQKEEDELAKKENRKPNPVKY